MKRYVDKVINKLDNITTLHAVRFICQFVSFSLALTAVHRVLWIRTSHQLHHTRINMLFNRITVVMLRSQSDNTTTQQIVKICKPTIDEKMNENINKTKLTSYLKKK